MDSPLVYFTSVFVLGIAAQWVAWRIKLPAILLLLATGFIVGQILGPSRVETLLADRMLFPFVSLSVALILFEGGLTLRFREVRETSQVVWRLITVGSLLTWGLATAAALLVFEHPGLAALQGAILVVTGPTVILPLLRHVRPVRRIAALAKWEGITIDPVGALLAVLVYTAVAADRPEKAALHIAQAMLLTSIVGVVLGSAISVMLIQLLKRHWVPDYLHSAVVLAAVLGAFTTSSLIQPESGLATVTLIGIVLANQRHVPITHVIHFKENLGVLLLSSLFILLASRLELRSVVSLGWGGAGLLTLLIFVVRPVSVFISTIRTSLSWQERTFLAFLAPRGIVAAAVSAVFALELHHLSGSPLVAAEAEKLVPLTFLVIIGTVTFYGLTAAPLARLLKIADPDPQGILFAGADSVVQEIAQALQKEDFPVLLVDTDHRLVAEARMKGLPAWNASITSDYVREQVNLGGIGRLLAMTSNDEVNSLAALQFLEHFGRVNVFQLHPEHRPSAHKEAVSAALRGRFLFGPNVTHERLEALMACGGTIRKTKLSEEFQFDDYRRRYNGSALLLFVIDGAGKLSIWTGDDATEPKPGHTLVSLVDPTPAQVA